jgi:quercetin dioxygenase-like cupin family protein
MLTKKLAAILLVASATTVFAQPAFKRTVLQTVDLSIAGREAVTGKAEIPAGIAAGAHTHPGEEIGYVLEGTVTIELDGTKKTLKAGDTFAIPAGKVHNAINAGQTQVTIVSTYIVEKGKPLATPVKQ